MENSKEIFALALGLQSPWKVSEVRFETLESGVRELHIELDFISGSVFSIGEAHNLKVHDSRQRSWRHLNFFEHKCYLNARVPRVITPDGKTVTVEVPWARPGSGFTLLFEAYCMLLIENEMPVNKAGVVVSENPHRLWTVFNHWIGMAYEEADHSSITHLGIDETSTRKGHNYITIGVDLKEKRVVHATEGKGADCVATIASYLEGKGSPAAAVEQVCIDLSPAFISGCSRAFEQAAITFDRFHVVALLGKAMDELRRSERKDFEALKGHKYLFLTRGEHLSEEQQNLRAELLEVLPKLWEGYRLKELFDLFWEMEDKEEAKGFLSFWCDRVQESGIAPFLRVAKTIKTHFNGIANYIESKISNGVVEGINGKIQLAKRRARGYRDTNNLINMVYFLCGKLKFNYPHYSA